MARPVLQQAWYLHSSDNHVIAGALLGVGIVNCRVNDDNDPALALLPDYMDKEDTSIRIGAIMGLGLSYAGIQMAVVQHFLSKCAQHPEKGKKYQGPAVLGIAMVAMGEELGLEMAIRLLEYLLQYGKQNIRRAVPLALGLLCISNPKVNAMDMLSRLGHDTDTDVAMAAVISLGLTGAGTNNATIAGMLRNFSSYYYKEANLLFCVRRPCTYGEGLVDSFSLPF